MVWPVNARTSAMLDELQALCGFPITVTQGSPSTSDPSSAGTHSGEGVFDAVGADLDVMVVNGRKIGFAIWHRTPAQGFPHHVHGVAVGEPLLSTQAQAQVDSYLAGHNGLRGNGLDDGPRDWVGVTWETYSGGTYVPPTGGDPVTVYGGGFPGDRSGAGGFFPDGILTGTPAFTGGSPLYSGAAIFARPEIDDDPPPLSLHMDAGDSCFLTVIEDWLYYVQDETLTAGRYVLRVEGAGTLTLDDAFDEGFHYPTPPDSWTPQTALGPAGAFQYFTASADLLDRAHLFDDGSPLIRLTCTSGSVDITWAGMQIQTAAGYFEPDGDFAWSPNQPPSSREPASDSSTYHVYDDGGLVRWTVDDTIVPALAPHGIFPGYDAWQGFGTSLVDAQDARDASVADFQPWTTLNQTGAGADLIHYPYSISIPLPIPEHWDAYLFEKVSTFAAPTRAERPTEPDGYGAFVEYEASGFEWFDDDCGLMGWHTYDGNVGFTGDADVFTLYVTEVVDGFDTSTEWFAGGTVILEQTMVDVDPIPAIPALVAIPDTFLTTTAQLMARRLTLAREATDQLSFWTTENGYPAGNSGTYAEVDANNYFLARFRVPGWRYQQPTFLSIPGPPPVIDFDEDPVARYLRNRQRNDGLGGWSTPRAKGTSSRQLSLHNRGYE